jgi:hypothetical protein
MLRRDSLHTLNHNKLREPIIQTPEQGWLALGASLIQFAVLDQDVHWLRSDGAAELLSLISAASGVSLHMDHFLRRAEP